jgi:hypothetical protein
MLGIRWLVSVGSVVIGTLVALAVLLAIHRWLDVEVAGQVAVSMAVFAFARDLAVECLERVALSAAARQVSRLLAVHLEACQRQGDEPIPWCRLHYAVERLLRVPSALRLPARQCLDEIEAYSACRFYADIRTTFDMSKTHSLLTSLSARTHRAPSEHLATEQT